MKQWQLVLTVVVVALLAAAGGYQLQQHTKPEVVAEATETTTMPQKPISTQGAIGSTVGDFSLSGMEGEIRHSSEWDGKVVVINFWATWCPPCREEIPHFIALQEQYGSDGLQFVGVALQQAEEVRGFIEEYKLNYPSLVGGDDVIKLATKLGNAIGALPYTVIMDRSRKIKLTRRGPLSKREAEAVIKNLL